jgi:hypothetical protein
MIQLNACGAPITIKQRKAVKSESEASDGKSLRGLQRPRASYYILKSVNTSLIQRVF